jgi:hypothetical protein
MPSSRLNVHIGDKVFESWGPDTVTFDEAEAVETQSGLSWSDFVLSCATGHMTSMRILAWSLLRRDEPELKLEDVKLPISAVQIESVCADCGERVADERGEDGKRTGELVHAATLSGTCGVPLEEPDTSPDSEIDTSSMQLTSSVSASGSGSF